MTDIVERLRKPKYVTIDGVDCLSGDAVHDMQEAADYIERLRSLCGKADVGSFFSVMTSELRHQTPIE
jgi:hypothetical protein